MEAAKHEVKVNVKVQSDCTVPWQYLVIIITHNPGLTLLQNWWIPPCTDPDERKNKKENQIKEISRGLSGWDKFGIPPTNLI